MKQNIFVIIGPTASGKSGFAETLAEHDTAEIINADTGQFYVPLTIGTAKPAWRDYSYKAHLFDILNTPSDMSAYEFRSRVIATTNATLQRNKTPLIVGGSLFYIKSLFFPPQELDSHNQDDKEKLPIRDPQKRWEFLHKIDPERAKKLHPHDIYRVNRAITIWEKTGQKPSEYAPQFSSPFDVTYNVSVVVINPEKHILDKRIMQRTVQMLDAGWIDETKKLINTPWQAFVIKKGLIGYKEIFEWIQEGEDKNKIDSLIQKIQQNTLRYAKRQRTFLRSFVPMLKQNFLKNKHGKVFTTQEIDTKSMFDSIKTIQI